MPRSLNSYVGWIGALALLILALFCGGPITVAIQMRRTIDQLGARHVEAAALIDDIHAHYRGAKQWPTPNEAQSMLEKHGLDPAWTYFEPAGDIPPRLTLHGPLHGHVVYHFDTEGAGHWALRVEGSTIRKW